MEGHDFPAQRKAEVPSVTRTYDAESQCCEPFSSSGQTLSCGELITIRM